jgi:spore maturation protein CgeB
VDPDAYPPLERAKRWDLSYLGTYSPDRQPTLDRLLLEPARQAPHLKFVVAGPQYPASIAWPENVERIDHVPPGEHPEFYAASRFTLNVTRGDMIRAGYSPSVRLFEAATCGTPILSDVWDGIETILAPGQEIVLARGPGDVLDVLLHWPESQARSLAEAARHRVLARHTAAHRAQELETFLLQAMSGSVRWSGEKRASRA